MLLLLFVVVVAVVFLPLHDGLNVVFARTMTSAANAPIAATS